MFSVGLYAAPLFRSQEDEPGMMLVPWGGDDDDEVGIFLFLDQVLPTDRARTASKKRPGLL